jgi:hypothetical protein
VPPSRVERLGSAGDFAQWTREHALGGDAVVTESEAAAARELRSALLTMMMAQVSHPNMTEEQVRNAEQQLAHAAELYPVKITLSTAGSSVAGQGRGAAGVLGSVLAGSGSECVGVQRERRRNGRRGRAARRSPTTGWQQCAAAHAG